MKRLLLAALLAALPVAGHAQELARLFPKEADVFTPGPGLVRLALPSFVLDACAPDLSDLRLLDRDGGEVPYLVDAGAPLGGERREQRAVAARVLDLERAEQPRDGGSALTREALRLSFPDTPPAGETWTLDVQSARPRFVRTVEVRGVARDGTPTVLVPRASLVRLGQRLTDRTSLPLPRFDGSEITVTIEGEEGFFLEPTFSYQSARALPAGEVLEVPLPILDQRRGPGRTVVEVARPPGLMPARLRVATATPALDRAVTVWDVKSGAAVSRVGNGRLLRAVGARAAPAEPSPGGAVRAEPRAASLESLDVDLAAPQGDRLRLEIEDGDSPPLVDLRLAALVRQPALVFALPAAAEDGPAGLLLFGGDRAWRPHYDIAALFRDAPAAGAARLEDASALPAARLGAPRANPRFDAGPALAAVMRPGAALDLRPWRWLAPLQAPASPEGLLRVHLAAEDVGRARADLGDLRVVDGEQRQWPYMTAPAAQREAIELTIEGPARERGTSRWKLTSPVGPVPLDSLTLVPSEAVLARPYRLLVRDADDKERVLARGTLAQDLRQPAPLGIGFAAERVEQLELVVEDGDDAPLVLRRAEAPVAVRDLLVAAPAGSYRLMVGNPDASPPHYELERARAVVLGLKSVAASRGRAQQNPDWDASASPASAIRARERLTQVAVWAAIAVAVVVLFALTLRVVRGPSAGTGS